jgi:signal transduction histidine kinase
MESLSNLNLISVGIAVAAIAILGFVVFFNDRKSSTNKAFLLFSLISVCWSIINYLQYQIHEAPISFLILRIVIFLGVWHSFAFFQFCYVFPETKKSFPRWYKYFYLPIVVAASVLTLTPLVFSHITQVATDGSLIGVQNGPLIPVVALIILFSVVAGIVLLLRKTVAASAEQKRQFSFVMYGMLTTFFLLMIFNLILPAFFNDPNFTSLGAIFLLPFVAFTYYSISRYHLMNIKVISTEILAFILSVATLLEIIISQSIAEVLLRSGIFVLVLIFCVFLIRSVRHEVEQREELQRLNEKIEATNKQLAELGHFKSELLSLASHQIKSPLAAIKGFVTLIMEGAYGAVDDKIKVTLQKVEDSADELIALINTLLDVRKVEEGKMEYQFEKVDLGGLIAHVIDSVMPLAQAKSLALTSELEKSPVMVNIDKEKFRQVIQNLIDNAIKYTPTGFVKVVLKNEGGQAIIKVSDSGLGIPASLIPFLFEEFIRDERVKKEIRGTGLGLYIARKITEAHGGKLSAESPGEGKGSIFTITIPTLPA